MEIVKKLALKAKDNYNEPGVTIAFLGDSVTQGCFEIYQKSDGGIETVFDKNNAYHAHFAKILSVLYPTVPVNIINAGISGDNAPHGYERLERDVLRYNPDLVVVCYALNDSMAGKDKVEDYKKALANIFSKLKERNIEAIFMTPQMMNTYVSCHVIEGTGKRIAEEAMKIQNDGVLDMYLDEARKICNEYEIILCDCYKKWKQLYENGVDTTELLANKINHPTREMNWLFAYSLVETMMK